MAMLKPKRLTKSACDRAATPNGAREAYLADGEVSGFGLRVLNTGTKTFTIRYRDTGGTLHRHALGKFGPLTVEQARKRAKETLAAVAKGENPAQQRRADRDAPTLAGYAAEVMAENAARWSENYRQDVRGIFARHVLPGLGRKKVADVTPADVRKLHNSLKAHPALANKTLAVLSRTFAIAVTDAVRTGNPCKGIRKFHEEPRTRFLSDAEVHRLTSALKQHPNQSAANAVRLLILTGARRNEALRATWDMFDFERRVWTKPSHHTKQRREHRTDLNTDTLALLAAMKEQAAPDCPFLFPRADGTAPVADIKRAWKAILRAADLADVHLHDLRHTFASHLASGGVSLLQIGKLLGHTQPSTTQRYAQLSDDSMRRATNSWGEKYAALEKGQTGEVIPLSRHSKAG